MNTAGIVLCAGFGTRLKPLTLQYPKPAISFLGHPMVWYALNRLKAAGITTIGANVHYLPERMAACLCRECHDLGMDAPRIFCENGDILGTGGGARGCMDLMPEADVFVIHHGDVLCNADLSEALRAYAASHAQVMLVVCPRPKDSTLGMIGITDGQIVQIRNWKSPNVHGAIQPCCFTGIHIVSRQLLEKIPPSTRTCLVTEIYPQLLARGIPIHAYRTEAFFADIGTWPAYQEARQFVRLHPDILSGACIDA